MKRLKKSARLFHQYKHSSKCSKKRKEKVTGHLQKLLNGDKIFNVIYDYKVYLSLFDKNSS